MGRLTSIDRAFTDETRTYDSANRLLTIDNTSVGQATYTWDANSNKLSETWTGNMAAWSFTTEKSGGTFTDGYDAEDRFRRFIQSSQSNDIYLARSDIGNISDVEINSVSHPRSYSNAHELTSVDGTTQTFDDDGNLTLSHHGIAVAWDDANRLTQTVVPATATAGIEGTNDYGYDADGKRVFKKITRSGAVAEHTVYIYAGPNCISEYNSGALAASPVQEYVYSGGIDSLVLLSRNSDADRYVATRNQQWSITALADISNGTVQERYTYDPFGKRTILAPDGVTVRTASSYNMPYGYTSRRHDPESDLMYFRTRYYDPSTGEFTSRDPLEYVDGMSMMRGYMGLETIDPLGLRCQEDPKCGIVDNPKFDLIGRGYWAEPATEGRPRGPLHKFYEFNITAKFLDDDDHDCRCCRVRMDIKWDYRFHLSNGGPPHEGFPPDSPYDTWIEDRDSTGTLQMGDRGLFCRLDLEFDGEPGNDICRYEDEDGTLNCADGCNFRGKDRPKVPVEQNGTYTQGFYEFRLRVVDTCQDPEEDIFVGEPIITVWDPIYW